MIKGLASRVLEIRFNFFEDPVASDFDDTSKVEESKDYARFDARA